VLYLGLLSYLAQEGAVVSVIHQCGALVFVKEVPFGSAVS
jgi:hypothetical protein